MGSEGSVNRRALGLVAILTSLVVGACAPVGSGAGPSANAPVAPQGPKKVVTAIHGVLKFVPSSLNAGGGGRIDGNTEVNGLTSAGLVVQASNGTWQPYLAEQVPSSDNGMWKVQANGSSTTDWKLREGAAWHDGVPLTSEDYVFSSRLDQDKEMPWLVDKVYQ